jgi:hypothetical protein
MNVGTGTIMYFAAAVLCFVVVSFVLRWARPVNNELSARLRRPGMEGLITAIAVMTSLMGLAFIIGGLLGSFK